MNNLNKKKVKLVGGEYFTKKIKEKKINHKVSGTSSNSSSSSSSSLIASLL